MTSKIVAFLDLGTNSARLMMVRIQPDQTYTILSDQKEVVRLGEGEFSDRRLQPEAMQRALEVCRQFGEMARSYHAEEIVAVATSATREARNQDEFLRRMKQEAGIEMRVISGREEARLIYQGVVSGIHLGEREAVFIDIGGGSTEVIVGDQQGYRYLDSLKLGAIRLTSLFFLPDESGPVTPARYALIQQYVRNAAVLTIQRVQEYGTRLAWGSSGTIENLGDIAIQHFFGRKRTRDDVLTREQLGSVVELLCSLPLDERRKLPGINPRRADIIVGGAAILHTLMQEFDLPEIHICSRGLRDGLLVDYLAQHAPQGFVTLPVRERSVLHLGRACRFDESHARHVADLTLNLWDSAAKIGLHTYGPRYRELLHYAALLHDIGTFLSYSNHQAHSYYLIRNSDLLGFNQSEITLIAATAYFHRKRYPSKKHPQYAALDKKSRRVVRVMAILLRIAESLDRSHAGVVQRARLRKDGKKRVRLELFSEQDCQLEIWGVRNHLRAFEKTFGRQLSVSVRKPSA